MDDETELREVDPRKASYDAEGLPRKTKILYIVLFYVIFFSITFMSRVVEAAPTDIAPVDGSVFTNAVVTWTWTDPQANQEYWVYLGTTPGSSDLYTSSQDAGAFTEMTFTYEFVELNQQVYFTLWNHSIFGGAWSTQEFDYTTWNGSTGGGDPPAFSGEVELSEADRLLLSDISERGEQQINFFGVAFIVLSLFAGFSMGYRR